MNILINTLNVCRRIYQHIHFKNRITLKKWSRQMGALYIILWYHIDFSFMIRGAGSVSAMELKNDYA